MISGYQGTVLNGQITLEEKTILPEGAQVIVIVVTDDSSESMSGFTGQELLESGLVGMWADREDITDGAEFAHQLRERAQRRE